MPNHSSEVWESRWDWAAQAVDEFRADLDPALREVFRSEVGDVAVVLYGATQVGKTTLLLNLLGVAEAHAARVAAVLRGGRQPGRSATAVPMRYRWSSGESRWELSDPAGAHTAVDEADVARLLASLRGGDGSVRWDDVRPLTVGLPRAYRDPSAGSAMPHVLDLPGIQPADAAENAAVERLVQHHVPAADIVVLVSRSDQMSAVCAAAEKAELDWLSCPERFRIVLTFAATVGYRDMPPGPDVGHPVAPVTVDSLRSAALDQLATFLPAGRELPADVRNRVCSNLYPVEYGRSWDDAPAEIRHRFGGVITELLGELRGQIDLAAVGDGRYLLIPRAARIVQNHMDRRRSSLAERHAGRERAVGDAVQRVERCSARLQQAQHDYRIARGRHELADLAEQAIVDIEVHAGEPAALDPADEIPTWLFAQHRALKVATARAGAAWLGSAACRRLAENARHPRPERLLPESAVDAALDVAHGCCGSCSTNALRRAWFGAPEPAHCHRRLDQAWPVAAAELRERLQAAARAWVAAARAKLPDLDQAQATVDEAATRVERAREDLAWAQDAAAVISAELEAHDEDAARSLESASKLLEKIDAYFSAHVKELHRRISRTTDPEERAWLSTGVLLAHHNRDRIAIRG